MVITIWLIEHPSRKRIYRLTSDEVNALRAYKRGEADAAQRLLCLPLLDRARHDKLWFECGCRREGSQYPDFHARRHRNGEYTTANRPSAQIAHAEKCVFRAKPKDDRPAAGPSSGPESALFGAARKDTPGGPDPDAGPNEYGRPPPMPAARMTTTLWGTASEAGADGAPQPALRGRPAILSRGMARGDREGGRQALFAAQGADVPGSCSPTPPPGTRAEVAAKLEKAAPDWPGGGEPGAILCWPVGEVSGREVDPGGEGHVEAPGRVVCPSIGRRPVIGPYLFLGAVDRSTGRWACVDACARPIAALDCPVPVDSELRAGRALGALRRLVETLAGNPELAALLGGPLRIELERPLALIETTAGTCQPDFLLSVVRPSAHGHLPVGPDDPPYLGTLRSALPGAIRDRGHRVRQPRIQKEKEEHSPPDEAPRAAVPDERVGVRNRGTRASTASARS